MGRPPEEEERAAGTAGLAARTPKALRKNNYPAVVWLQNVKLFLRWPLSYGIELE